MRRSHPSIAQRICPVRSSRPAPKRSKALMQTSSCLPPSHSQVGAPHAVILRQLLICAAHDHVSGLQYVGAVRKLQSLADTLFDEQDGQSILAMKLADALEDRVR